MSGINESMATISKRKKSPRKLDALDQNLLSLLSQDPQMSQTKLAERIGVSELTVANRVTALTRDKIIRITVQRDAETLGYKILGFADVFAEGGGVDRIADQVAAIEQVFAINIAMGHPQIVVIVMAHDLKGFDEVVGRIAGITGVSRIVTSIAFDVINHKPGIAALTG